MLCYIVIMLLQSQCADFRKLIQICCKLLLFNSYIILVFKKGSRSDSYRSIAYSATLCKFMESMHAYKD